jgi:hypothetical protein
MTKRSFNIRTWISIFLALTTMSSFAQKAESIRISFARGSTSSRVQGILRGRQDAEYVLSARHGQTLSLFVVSSPAESIEPRVYGQKNTEITMRRVGVHGWTAPLGEDGDYNVVVSRVRGAPGSSTYKLTVAIR